MPRKTLTLILACVLVGILLGATTAHVVHLSGARSPQRTSVQAETYRLEHYAPDLTSVVAHTDTRVVTNTVMVVDRAGLESLEEELERLEKELEQKEHELTALQADLAKATEQRPRRESWREREERMKEEDPERYEQIQKERQAFRERMNNAVADRAQFLEELDTSAMSEDEQVAHDELLERIAQTWGMIEQLQGGGTMPSRETRTQLHEQFHAISELYEVERDYVLRQVGTDLGFGETEAQEFSEYIGQIYEMTSPRFSRGMMGGGRGGSSAPTTAAP